MGKYRPSRGSTPNRGSGPKSMVAYSVAIVACLMIFTVGYAVADYALTSAGVYDLPGFFSSVTGPVETGQVEITDNLNFALTDANAKSAVASASIYILDTEGGVLEGPLTTASNGIIASGREYASGTRLIIEVAKTGYVTQFYDYVVPTMSQADLSKNPTTHYTKDLTITYLGTYSISVVDSSGTSYTTGSTTYNWTDKGVTTDTFTITIRETVANRGWASSYDPINKQAQNVVAQMYFNGSGYQSIANGYSSSYTWGSVKSWFKAIDDSTLCRQTQGTSVLKEGITTFTITVNQGAFASGCEQLTIDLRDYFSTTVFSQQGDGGASDASLTSFELLFIV